jgi:hypothetical protein
METYFSSEYPMMRKILRFLIGLYKIKGTVNGYKVLFRMIGIDGEITITEYSMNTGFDSSITLDDPIRRLDSYSATCSPYSIVLTGIQPMTDELIAQISSVVVWNEPINAKLISLTYNGSTITIINKQGSFSDSFANAFD